MFRGQFEKINANDGTKLNFGQLESSGLIKNIFKLYDYVITENEDILCVSKIKTHLLEPFFEIRKFDVSGNLKTNFGNKGKINVNVENNSEIISIFEDYDNIIIVTKRSISLQNFTSFVRIYYINSNGKTVSNSGDIPMSYTYTDTTYVEAQTCVYDISNRKIYIACNEFGIEIIINKVTSPAKPIFTINTNNTNNTNRRIKTNFNFLNISDQNTRIRLRNRKML